MPYTNDLREVNVDALKARIPGWGADLDPADRPGVPMERMPPGGTGAHWTFPERQVPRVRIHRSTEHTMLPPVFGTSCPPKGLSGFIRDRAYKLSEGRSSHWMLLLLADRVDVVESALSSLLRLRPHNPLAEMGMGAELRRGAFRSRFGQHRADVRRLGKEALLVAGLGAAIVGRAVLKRAA